jgi:programmed cell death 6-interacting protein
LPAALEDTTGVTVPPSVIEKSEQVQREGGIKKIEDMLRELPDLLKCNQEILNEVRYAMVLQLANTIVVDALFLCVD